MNKPQSFTQEEINAAVETKSVVIEESNHVWKGIHMAGEINVYQEWAKSNREIVERLESIRDRWINQRDIAVGNELEELIKELKDQ